MKEMALTQICQTTYTKILKRKWYRKFVSIFFATFGNVAVLAVKFWASLAGEVLSSNFLSDQGNIPTNGTKFKQTNPSDIEFYRHFMQPLVFINRANTSIALQ